jgi:hypothetical protein
MQDIEPMENGLYSLGGGYATQIVREANGPFRTRLYQGHGDRIEQTAGHPGLPGASATDIDEWDQTTLPPVRIDRTKMTVPGLPEGQWIEAHHNEHGELMCFEVHFIVPGYMATASSVQRFETWDQAVAHLIRALFVAGHHLPPTAALMASRLARASIKAPVIASSRPRDIRGFPERVLLFARRAQAGTSPASPSSKPRYETDEKAAAGSNMPFRRGR